jgi:hypothetical protein
MWEPQPLTTLKATRACTGIALPLPFIMSLIYISDEKKINVYEILVGKPFGRQPIVR